MIPLTDFHATLAGPGARGYALNTDQRDAVDHDVGPLWLLAGPGSGKSEVLVTRTLRLLCVTGVHPGSILLTTFTTKAARNLEDRLATYLSVLQQSHASLAGIDLADLRIGTLHSLCNDILHEVHFPAYQNTRLLDEVEQHLFLYRFAEIVKCDDAAFWAAFESAVGGWSMSSPWAPNQWQRTKAATTLFNRIVEDCVDVAAMRQAPGEWQRLAEFYTQYADALTTHHRCDFAHLQARFLEFLESPTGHAYLVGDPDATAQQLPLRHVLVDEYQDTNPIQERIYLALASEAPHNLTVCGDDDQALYRFRGGTVACMVHFGEATQARFGVAPTTVQLADNYRSHGDIVGFFNHYIGSFAEMATPGVRAPGKSPVRPSSAIGGQYPAISWVSRSRVGDLPEAVAELVQDHLMADNIIQDWSQCVLLMRSAKDSARNAGPYLARFRERGIPVYCPRSKSFMESEEVQCLLAALVQVVDFRAWFGTQQLPAGNPPEWVSTVGSWIDTLNGVVADATQQTGPLEDYVRKSVDAMEAACRKAPGGILQQNLMEIVYRILANEPFPTWRKDPTRNSRIAKVTRLFESYHSLMLDTLRVDAQGDALEEWFLRRFYTMFLAYLINAGLNDDEDEEVIVPQGYLPIMTIHQSKGLEFPFVVAAQLGHASQVGAAQQLELQMAQFRQDLYARPARNPAELAIEDDIRLLYVAYSRAQYGLVLAATPTQVKDHLSVPGRDHKAFKRDVPKL